MGEQGRGLGIALVCALALPVAGAGLARAETGFDVAVEGFEITGDSPFADAFDDGLRDAAPTVHFLDRGATEVSEQDGALRLTDDDGADGSPGFDLTVLDRPLRRGEAAATLAVSLRGGAGGALRGLVLAPGDPGAGRRGLALVAGRGPLLAIAPPAAPGSTPPPPNLVMGGAVLFSGGGLLSPPGVTPQPQPGTTGYSFVGAPIDPTGMVMSAVFNYGFFLRESLEQTPASTGTISIGYPTSGLPLPITLGPPAPVALCGVGGAPIVALTDGVVTACAELPAGSEDAPIDLRIEALAASPLVRAAYSLDGGASFVAASAWRVPAPIAGVALPPGATFPGLLARAAVRPGARWIDYTGLVGEDGITRGAGGAMVKLEGTLSRQRFPSRPEAPVVAGAGTFSLVSADGRDLRVAPGTVALDTPRGRLRGVAEAAPVQAGCAASAGFTSLDRSLCGMVSGAAGTDLSSSDPSVVLQSWTGFGGGPPNATDPRPQPGTAGFTAGPVCSRVEGGQIIVLPGCSRPGDPGYDPAIDPNPTTVGIGYPADLAGLLPLGNSALDPRLFIRYHPFTGQAWQSDAAALSWDLQALMVSFSADAGASVEDSAEVFDPERPYRTDGCSYVLPEPCREVRALRSLAIEALPDDPAPGAAPLRWLWQLGASFRITVATGELAALLGGRLHVAGPARSEIPDVASIVGFFATPPPVVDADADGVREPKDRCPARANSTQEDADADRVGDACDVCILETDPSQRDTDGDGIGNRCDADLDNDGRVALRDLALMKARLYTHDPHADLDGDGRVNLRDLVLMKRRLFRPPGPAAPRTP